MTKRISNLLHILGRLVKAALGLLLIPLVIGIVLGLRRQLDGVLLGDRLFTDWAILGGASYLGIHLLLYKPAALFSIQHGMLSRISLWLFGGQVTTVEPPKAGSKDKEKKKAAKGNGGGAQGSTLLALSPYVVPLYAMLACGLDWALRQRWEAWWIDAGAAVLIGAALTMHWVMAADRLQQDRERFPIDAYVLALGIIGVVSLLIVTACLPLAAPGFSLPGLLADAFTGAAGIYSAVLRTLFF